MSDFEEQAVATGRIKTYNWEDEVKVSITGAFYGTVFTFAKDHLTGAAEDVSLTRVSFYEDERSARIAAIYEGEEGLYIADGRLNDVRDIDGEYSTADFLTVRRDDDGLSWADSMRLDLWTAEEGVLTTET